ncbi:MAG: hypothetical protein NTW52_08750 [Planctomycetota bacterium]|nr:hypothetical protein [Planctomycetota bacterium]
MNTKALYRKAAYICGIVALLLPLFLLGQPPTVKSTGSSAEPSASASASSSGGLLSQIRDRYDIGQASLGQLDPASETMRLATLGLRGVAATILWQKSDYYKTEKYYDRLSATLNQLALLQPHFVSVWDSQAHNLAYNVSVEFDDYRERYAWVKKGIDYLVTGTKFNRRQPILQWHLGKYMTQKLGRSDEKRQFRELFRNDDEYHQKLVGYGLDVESADARGPDRKPDNWLVGRLWFLKAYDLVRAGAYCKKNPLYFYAENPYALMYSAEAMEEEGTLDDKAMFAWSRASNEWDAYGALDIMTSWGHTVQLGKYDVALQVAKDATAKFDALVSDVRKEVIANSKDKLTEDEFAAVNLPPSERTPEQQYLVDASLYKYMPAKTVLIQMLPKEKRTEALALASDVDSKEEYATHVGKYRDQCNYEYWEMRGRLEQKPTTVAARRQMYEADQFLAKGDLDKSMKLYEAAWQNWARVFRAYPKMMTEESADEVLKAIKRYGKAADISLEDSFALSDFLKYRTIRDRNKMSEVGNELFETMLKESPKHKDSLDSPYQVGDAVPEPVIVQLRSESEVVGKTDGKPKSASTQTNETVPTQAKASRADRNPASNESFENVEFVTPDSPRAMQPLANLAPATESAESSESATTRPPTLVVPE